jgi:putative transferase (TIGR04331 family)
MNNHSDWTETLDQNIIAKKANSLVDDLLKQIFDEKLEIHNNLNLTFFELNLLYGWQLHVGVNAFIERMLRVFAKKTNVVEKSYPLSNLTPAYFNNTVTAVSAYYHDISINYKLLNDISKVIVGTTIEHLSSPCDSAKPQGSLSPQKRYSLKIVLKNILFQCENIFIRITKPKVVGEYSYWLRKLFLFGNRIDFNRNNFSDQNIKIDLNTREDLKKIFNNIFTKNITNILDELDDQQIRLLANLFSDWMDHILPLSVIEGLNKRFDYYKIMMKGWPIEQVHSFTGYFYNDNFKIFTILAKRSGAKLIGHIHGATNYKYNLYHLSYEQQFVDYYITYGTRVTDDYLSSPRSSDVKFIPIGSTAFHALKKWNRSKISIENFTLLYPSGPLRNFMTYLQEISPEKNLEHRLQVLTFLEKLLRQYPGLRVIYKPFPGTFTNDPIKEKCAKWFDEDRIELTEKHPGDLYHSVDVVLWDSISTGFVESIVAGVPVIVFTSAHEYEQTTPCGKSVNNALTEAGVQCFDFNSAIWSFERILKDLDRYKKETAPSIQMIMKDMGMSVSKKEWHRRFRNGINASERI